MYTITADNTVLFRSFDKALSREMYKWYKSLYAWAWVKVTRA